MKRLQWTERAFADLADILDHYNEIDPTLGIVMRRRIAIAEHPLLAHPAIGSPVGPHGTRKWRVQGTPFLLLYRILTDGAVQILHVRHVAQDWRSE